MIIKPNEYHKNVTTINWKRLYAQGYNTIVFDIDNTLDIPDKQTIKSVKLEKFLKDIEMLGFDIYFMSNNHQDRVESFTNHYNYKYSYDSKKPFQKKYHKLLEEKNPGEVIFVGDKIVTDIIGGNLFRGYTILVDPLTQSKKYWYTKFMNFVEEIFRTITGFKKGSYYD